MADLTPTLSTVAQVAGYGDSYVKPGDRVYITTSDQYYVYRNPGSLPAIDGTNTIKAIFLPGFWELVSIGSGSTGAMGQLNWFIDPLNGNDANNGATATTALSTDGERQRRMGPNPLWNAGAYHIRYLNDVPATDPVRIVGTRARNSNIFLHGSAIDGQGQSILRSGTITALTTLDNTTVGATTSWQITDSGIPVSWTASNLINRRIRLTSGASIGAKSFAIVDLGSRVARCDEFLVANTYTFPFNFIFTKAPPSNGNTYVVERLTSIVNFYWNVQDVDDGGLNTTFRAGCVESLALGVDSAGTAIGDFNVVGSSAILCFDGCMVVWFGDGYSGNFFYASTGIYGTMIPGLWQNVALHGGHYIGSAGGVNVGLDATNLFIEFVDNFIFQATSAGLMRFQAFCQFFDCALFDTSQAVRLQGTRSEFRGKLWGTGNAGRIVDFDPGARVLFDANAQFNLSVTGTPEFGFIFNGSVRTSIPAFDTATNTYTADRTATLAHLTATIAGGGFNNSMLDPVNGGGIVKQ